MITPLVLNVFARLASSDAAMGILEEVAEGQPATPSRVSRFLDAVSDADSEIRKTYGEVQTDLGGDAWEAVRDVIEDVLRNVHDHVGNAYAAFSRKDVQGLLTFLRSVVRNAAKGTDRGSMSPGIRDDLEGFDERLREGDEGVWKDVGQWIEAKFPQPIASLTNFYMYTHPVGWENTKGSLLASEHGADARRIATDTILGLFFEAVKAKLVDHSYQWTDRYETDMKLYNTIAANVRWKIRNRDTGDKYDIDKPKQSTARKNWVRYVEPLRGTDMFASGRPDLGAIAEWLNDNFRKDSPTDLTVALSDGGTMTAPPLPYKRPLTRAKLETWYTATLPVQSLDMEMGEDGGTLGESLAAPEQAPDEEKRVEHLNESVALGVTRRDVARNKLKTLVKEAVEAVAREGKGNEGGVTSKNRDVIERIMLIKLGLASGSERSGFRKETLSAVRRVPFKSYPNEAEWKAQGKPTRSKRLTSIRLKDGTTRPPDPPEVLNYTHDFDQKALVWKEGTAHAGEQFVGTLPTLKAKHDDLKLVNVTHKSGEPVDMRHFRNWAAYSEEDREKDLDFALDVYDGQKWYQHSIDPGFRERLEEENADLSKVFEGFDPMNMMRPFSWNSDKELLRALGQVLFTPQVSSDSLNPIASGMWVPLRNVRMKLGELLEASAKTGDYLPLEYLALKGSGAIASVRRPLLPVADRFVKAVVESLMWQRPAGK